MRAGSLSDNRVIALLRKYFVTVHVPELSTAELISDPADEALLERYHEELTADGGSGLFGGVREVLFAPGGELITCFASLWTYSRIPAPFEEKHLHQLFREGRVNPKSPPMRRFWRKLRAALEETHGAVPEDFGDFVSGAAPEVAVVAAERPAAPVPAEASAVAMRVWVRNSMLMYDTLVGCELVLLDRHEVESILPEGLNAGDTCRWPTRLFSRLARSLYPRGHVWTRLREDSVDGELHSAIRKFDGLTVSGDFTGEFELTPSRAAEVSHRAHTGGLFRSRAKLRGYFTWDIREQRFGVLRITSHDGSLEYAEEMPPGWSHDSVHDVAIEMVYGPPEIATLPVPSTEKDNPK